VPWAQRRGADGVQVRDGTDDSAHVQGAKARCARPPLYGSEGNVWRGARVARGGEPAGVACGRVLETPAPRGRAAVPRGM